MDNDKCKSCGTAYIDHLGLIGTCARFRLAAMALRSIQATLTMVGDSGLDASGVSELREMCSRVLSEVDG